MTLRSCPFCRKPFAASRIVKLHVDRPAASEQGVEDVELLRRLDAEEAKRQVELEAAVEQSKQRKRELRESLERAQRLQKQREEEAEARKQQHPTVAGKSASGAVPWSWRARHAANSDFTSSLMSSATPPSTRFGQGTGGGWRARAANSDLTSSLVSSAAPPPTQSEGGVWRAPRPTSELTTSLVAPPSTQFGQGWRAAARQNTNADLTSSLAS
ncbi:hypothetical protein K443DRAFT_680843 [Laccaria amethystina LaAM-08-1]|uniref:Uncharacterized protein n=1 Tax=Laccaria amethystina LaAM-08-1 TaxID=1095629 RepID=A0A0C9XLH5_9AGAR|nr:hypothetical protein K443DRAFT_680843 [Laccaria amethystina LaAM-08-1]